MKAERRRIDGILLLDKPSGLTSNAALQRVKRAFAAEKAGHTGSLDPLASGVLPICLGRATRVSGLLLDADKCYRARARLGCQTDTGDSEGVEIASSDPGQVERAALEAAAVAMRGAQEQIPPMYSALKHEGQPLYRLARQGRELPRAARPIHIYELELLAFEPPDFEFHVRCSKGTYVRTLAEDLAAHCGQRAHLVALRRTALGAFQESSLTTLADLEALASVALRDARLLDAGAAVADWPRVEVDGAQSLALAHGRVLMEPSGAPGQRVAVFDGHQRLLGLAEFDGGGHLAPRVWLASPEPSAALRL
jgi:tRNA pseudouridine55 synthase